MRCANDTKLIQCLRVIPCKGEGAHPAIGTADNRRYFRDALRIEERFQSARLICRGDGFGTVDTAFIWRKVITDDFEPI